MTVPTPGPERLSSPLPFDTQLADACAACYADPLAFVLQMYPWPIKGEPGPDAWQVEALRQIGAQVAQRRFNGVDAVLPVRFAVSSGHGIGKDALFAWLTNWIMSTRPRALGTITANTNDQLANKTWAALRYWTGLCLTSRWFEINSAILFRKGSRASWFCAPQSCAPENSEAFAGQHAKDSTSFYIFSEASAIPASIWPVAEGGLTDGEPMFFIGGNPTRRTGAFHAAVFGIGRDRWHPMVIDSRTSRFTNKPLIAQWAEDYGEESDFFRVRVRGLPPHTDETQFIPEATITAAQARVLTPLEGEPLIAGVDVSGGGSAWTVLRMRRGQDARLPPLRISGERSQDRTFVVSQLAARLQDTRPGHQIAAMFIDAAFGAAIVERLRALGYPQVQEVSFGGPSPDPHQANQRAYQWAQMKEWLWRVGAIDPKDERLATDLAGPGYHLNKKNELVLESKESMRGRGVASPDDGDALSLTFAQPVGAPRARVAWRQPGTHAAEMNWAE